MKLQLVIVVAFFTLSAYGQTLLPKVGFTCSINSMEVTSGEIISKVGFTAGLAYNLHLNKAISIQPELNFIQKAFESQSSTRFSQIIDTDTYFVNEDRSRYYRISYLEVPLLVKVRLFHNNFFAIAGPSVAYGLGGFYRYKFDQTTSYFEPTHTRSQGKVKFGDDPEASTNDAYFDNRWDIGVQAGVGALLFKKIMLEGRYGVGTTNLISDKTSKNGAFQIAISCPIKLVSSK